MVEMRSMKQVVAFEPESPQLPRDATASNSRVPVTCGAAEERPRGKRERERDTPTRKLELVDDVMATIFSCKKYFREKTPRTRKIQQPPRLWKKELSRSCDPTRGSELELRAGLTHQQDVDSACSSCRVQRGVSVCVPDSYTCSRLDQPLHHIAVPVSTRQMQDRVPTDRNQVMPRPSP